jgi:uncharacterized cupredoxin-like copper-binding protein
VRARLAAAVAAWAAVAALLGGCGGGPSADATIVMSYSLFEPSVVTVRAGVPVAFTLRNDDPIEHEWIVGPPEVHAGHRTGTEPYHGTIPTEVTVPPLSTRHTVVQFDEPGEYAFICHLPGHEDYGMTGVLRVVGG